MAHEPDETPDASLPADFARDLRQAARAGPDAASRARIERAVRARTSGGGGGGGAARIALAVVAVAALGIAYLAFPREAPVVVAVPPPVAAPVVAPEPIVLPEPPPVETVPVAEAPRRAAREVDVPTEIELLDAAHGALAASPSRALGYLDRHASLYPDGLFAEEREALAIEALVRLERRARAEARADRFFRAHPTTAHRAHLLELLRPTDPVDSVDSTDSIN